MRTHESYFFCGIGGSGMSAIAQVLCARGFRVRGSDRSRDRGQNPETYDRLEAQGIELVPQDGSGIDDDVTTLVVSSAVESTIPDVKAAIDRGLTIRKRAEILAELLHGGLGIAVGGTSGKSTVTGMIGHILVEAGRDPTVIAGGRMLNADRPPLLGNAILGGGEPVVVEADESDGTIELYNPAVAVITNISLDHRPLDELRTLFGNFAQRATTGVVMNADCAESRRAISDVASLSFGFEAAADVYAEELETSTDGVRFRVAGVRFDLPTPGRHNAANALAAVAACRYLDVSLESSADALRHFKGIGRRLQVLGEAGGVTVIDDFAHNPDKIAASLATLTAQPGRLRMMFQPHGYGPTRMLKEGLIASFVDGMRGGDVLWLPEIYFAGGTATKDISSRDLVEAIQMGGRDAHFLADRNDIVDEILATCESGDRVVVMGARDDTLTAFAENILQGLSERSG
jgi:UDP-N-acetylmuramate--alanine ligase